MSTFTTQQLEVEWQYFLQKIGRTELEVLSSVNVQQDLPKYFGVGLTERCNFNCGFCYYKKFYKNGQGTNSIDFNRMLSIVKSLAPIKNLIFDISGEPFLYHRLYEFLDRTQEYANSFSFCSNMSKVNIKNINILSKYNIQTFVISTESSNQNSYEKYRKGGSFIDFCKNTNALVHILQDKVICNTIVFQENMNDVIQIPQFLHSIGVQTLEVSRLYEDSLTISKGFRPCPHTDLFSFLMKCIEACEKYSIQLLLDSSFAPASIMNAVYEATSGQYGNVQGKHSEPCLLPWIMLQLTPTEKCLPCRGDMQPYVIDTNDFEGVYNSRYIKMLRAMTCAGVFPTMCQQSCHKRHAAHVRDVSQVAEYIRSIISTRLQ